MSDGPGFGFPRALANLYEDPEWSQKDLAGPTELLKAQVTKSKLGVLAPSQLRRYRQELAERARLGHPACFTNLWALINEALLHDEVWAGCSLGRGVGGQSHGEVQRWEQPWAAGVGEAQAPGSHGFRFRSSPHPCSSPMTTNSQTSGQPWVAARILCPSTVPSTPRGGT